MILRLVYAFFLIAQASPFFGELGAWNRKDTAAATEAKTISANSTEHFHAEENADSDMLICLFVVVVVAAVISLVWHHIDMKRRKDRHQQDQEIPMLPAV